MSADPFVRLTAWLGEAGGANRIEAIAMCLATAGSDARPSARMVLLRGFDSRGLRFFSSYESRKGRELSANAFAAAVLYWPWMERQVRIEGVVSMLSESESDEYFDSRPRGHQLAAWASEQSAPIESHGVLEERFAHFEQRFEGEAVPRPHSWGGYLLAPSYFEFWQGRQNRMHERIEYRRRGNDWEVAFLQP